MKNFQVRSNCLGDCVCCNKYEGIAFDGHHYYLSEPCHCKIYKCDEKMDLIQCTNVCRPYTQICYDTKGKCFWACTMDCDYKIYKLDECLNEIDYIQIPYKFHRYGSVVSISYDYMTDHLFVGITNAILEVNQYDLQKTTLKVEFFSSVVLSVVAFCGHFIVIYLVDGMQKANLYNSEAEEIRKVELNKEYILIEGVQIPHRNKVQLCFLAMKRNCYSYMMLCEISGIHCKPECECHPCPPVCECHPCPPVCECHPCPPVCECHPCPPVCECHPCPPVHECHPCKPNCYCKSNDAYCNLRNQECNIIDCCNSCGNKKELCECLENLCIDDYYEYDVSQ
ncbi:MAG: hypothetical protein RSB96_01215 [Oscillospiraceae bacterium]